MPLRGFKLSLDKTSAAVYNRKNKTYEAGLLTEKPLSRRGLIHRYLNDFLNLNNLIPMGIDDNIRRS